MCLSWLIVWTVSLVPLHLKLFCNITPSNLSQFMDYHDLFTKCEFTFTMHTWFIHQMCVYIHHTYMSYSPNVSLHSPSIHDLFTKCEFTFTVHTWLIHQMWVYIHHAYMTYSPNVSLHSPCNTWLIHQMCLHLPHMTYSQDVCLFTFTSWLCQQ